MTTFQNVKELADATSDGAASAELTDRLVWTSVFGKDAELRGAARFTVRTLAARAGIRPASIHDLYLAMGRGDASGFTVPAINVRAMSYDTARAVIRAAKKLYAGAFIFEIARSEIGYTEQRPHEYAAVVLGAALRLRPGQPDVADMGPQVVDHPVPVLGPDQAPGLLQQVQRRTLGPRRS